MDKPFIALVKCDSCDWYQEEQNVYDWHNKPCPECKASPIISDEDLGMVKITIAWMEAMESAGFEISHLYPSSPGNSDQLIEAKEEGPGKTSFHVDTSSLRKKDPSSTTK